MKTPGRPADETDSADSIGARGRVRLPSRPADFDMTYRPSEEFFGPPLSIRLPGLIHLGLAFSVVALVVTIGQGGSQGALYDYLFRQKHLIDPYLAAGAFAASAVLSLLRDGMRGVQIRKNWIEYRELISAIWPKVRRYRWAQIQGVNFEESGSISLDLWDGRREFLPPVSNLEGLRTVLERLALARAIPVSGGRGLEDLS